MVNLVNSGATIFVLGGYLNMNSSFFRTTSITFLISIVFIIFCFSSMIINLSSNSEITLSNNSIVFPSNYSLNFSSSGFIAPFFFDFLFIYVCFINRA